MLRKLSIVAAICVLSAVTVIAQRPDGPEGRDGERPPGGGPPDDQRRGPPDDERRGPPPPNPLMEALDKNHDHILSAEEIAGAAEALKTLDKNKDGKLTEDELRPNGGPGGRPGGPPDGELGRGGPRRGGPRGRGPDDSERPVIREPRDEDGPPQGPDGDRPQRPLRRGRGFGGPGRGGPGGNGPGGSGPRGNGPGRPAPSPERFLERAMSFDADGDGKLSRDELKKMADEMGRPPVGDDGPRGGGRGNRGSRRGPGGGPGGPGGPGGEPYNRPERPDRPE